MFSLLDTGLQNVIMYNYDLYVKALILLLSLAFSSLYLFYFKPFENKTVYFSVAFYRVLCRAFSYVLLATSPLYLIFFMNPYATYDKVFIPFMWFYFIVLTGFGVGIVADFFYYGVPALLEKAGIDMKNDKVKYVSRKWFGNKLKPWVAKK